MDRKNNFANRKRARRRRKKIPTVESKLPAEEERMLEHLRLAFRELAGKAAPDRIARLTVLAFRLEFPDRRGRSNGLGNAYVRAIPALRKALADEGGSIDAAEAARRLGVSRATLLRRYREKRLVGWRDYPGAEVRFPAWQFVENGLLPGLEEVMAILRTDELISDFGTILFFVSQYHSLDGQRPLDCLREGNVEDAVRTAHAHTDRS